MKVLHIISSGGMYGAEAVILNLSRALDELGHQSSIASFANLPHPNLQLHEAARNAGIETHLIECQGQLDPKVSRRIRDLVKASGTDVVHAHGYKADIYTWAALRNSGLPLVSTCHNWIDDSAATRIYGALDRFALRHYDAVAAVSREVIERLRRSGVKSERLHIVNNGIDLGTFRSAPPTLRQQPGMQDRLLIGQVGRLSTEKGTDLLVLAASRVLQQVPAATFVVVGDGPDRASLEKMISESGIEDRFILLGRRTDIPSVLNSLDLVVSASRKEGLPISLLEAMASGRAVVATSVGEVPRVAIDRETALLVPAEQPAMLADAILELLRDPQRRKAMGAAGKQRVEMEFSARRMATEYLSLYSKGATSVRRKAAL